MNRSYKDYMALPKAISFSEFTELHQEILNGINHDDEAIEIYNHLVEKASEYAMIRSHWTTRDVVWKLNEDPSRTAAHDALIVYFNMLSRYLKSKGRFNAWRDALGYEEQDPNNRKRIGDFGCYLAFVHALNGR